MLDLLIINPGAAHGIYGELGDKLVAVEPPLWCRLIAGYIRDKGFEVQILDAEAERLSPFDVSRRVWELAPALVCVAVFGHQPSASTQQMHGASLICTSIKSCNQDTKIIMVGGHVSALPERTLREEVIDFSCVGEGPKTIEGLLSSGPLAEVPGLVWWKDKQVVINPRAPLMSTAELHGDTWDLLPMKLYRAHNWQCFDGSDRQPYASIYTSLGCPFTCDFCCINSPFGVNKYRTRDPQEVFDEIKMLHDSYGVTVFKIIDEMFVLKPSHYITICEKLIESGLGERLNIWAYARIDTVKPETLLTLRAAGIKWLALGIESGSEHVRDGAEKAINGDDIVSIVNAIRAADINVIGNYIFGLPDDTVETMQQTLSLAVALNTEFANFYCAMAYPGSKLYDQAIGEGGVLPSSWRGYSQHNDDCRPLDTKHVSAATVLKFRDEAFNFYFKNPDYLEMVHAKFGDETLRHVREMTKYQLKRKLLENA